MRERLACCGLAALISLFGCSGSDDDSGATGAGGGSGGASGASGGAAGSGGSGASSSGPFDFCRRWVDEFAAYVERCGCGTAAGTALREQSTLCETGGAFANLAAAVEAGDLVYDAAAADTLFARLHEPDPLCVEEVFRALALDSVELYSLGGVFRGTHALGSPCTMPVGYKGGISDCAEGVCAPDGAGGGVCILLVGPGEECDASGDDHFDSTTARLCRDQRLADPDGEYESAFDSLSCVPASAGSTTRVCAAQIGDGEPCQHGPSCQSGVCLVVDGSDGSGVCAARLADGEPCSAHRDCQSGACQNGEPRVCGAPLGDGEPCDYSNEACASGFCYAADGSSGFCVPAPTRAVGEPCSSSAECISSGHGSSSSDLCQAGVCIADICAAYSPP